MTANRLRPRPTTPGLWAVACVLTTLGLTASCAQPGPDGQGDPSSVDSSSGGGAFRVHYEAARTPEAQQMQDALRRSRVVEDFVDTMNDFVRVPRDVAVTVKDCDEANAFYSEDDHSIELCHQLPLEEKQLLVASGTPEAEAQGLVEKSAEATLFHEGGHALIGELELATTGREEDVADQMSAYMLTADPDTAQDLRTVAEIYRLQSQRTTAIDDLPFYDIHSLDKQRMVNFLCYAYGAYPEDFGDIVGPEFLAEERAEGCPAEYASMSRAWDELLAPHRK